MQARFDFSISRILFLLIILLAAGCSMPAMMVNPEWEACKSTCIEKKNTCMMEAPDSASVTLCDSEMSICLETCSQLPAHILVEQ